MTAVNCNFVSCKNNKNAKCSLTIISLTIYFGTMSCSDYVPINTYTELNSKINNKD